MPTIYWPSTLPNRWLLDMAYQQADEAIRTQMDSGNHKVRRRSSAVPDTAHTRVIFTRDEVERFVTWWRGTLGGGTLRFRWIHPITDAQVEMRFTQPPDEWVPGRSGTKWSGLMFSRFHVEIFQ